jgi:hypothetical protein
MNTAATAQAQKDIEVAVLRHTHALCEALRQNYIKFSISSHQNSIDNNGIVDETYVSYHQERIEKLKQGICNYDFFIESGRKYHKVIMNANGAKSVHCFIDKKTGEVYKSASWKAPAKGVRYDLRLIKDREWLLENATWHTGYLYRR